MRLRFLFEFHINDVNKSSIFFFIVFHFFLITFPASALDTTEALHSNYPHASWLKEKKFGLSTHYVAKHPKILPQLSNSFQVEKVAFQTYQSGAGWFIFTLFHQSWAMMSPNLAFDTLVGNSDYTSDKDIPLLLGKELSRYNIKLLLYINLRLDDRSIAPSVVKKALGPWPPDEKTINNICNVLHEFSLRYKELVAGWWIDGAWLKEYKGSPHREHWFKLIASSLRAGNPNSIIAFNPGIVEKFGFKRYSQQDDYIAGETRNLDFNIAQAQAENDLQLHLWTYLGDFWGLSGLRFNNEQVILFLRRCINSGIAVTFDVGTIGKSKRKTMIGSDDSSSIGIIDPRQINQLKLFYHEYTYH